MLVEPVAPQNLFVNRISSCDPFQTNYLRRSAPTIKGLSHVSLGAGVEGRQLVPIAQRTVLDNSNLKPCHVELK